MVDIANVDRRKDDLSQRRRRRRYVGHRVRRCVFVVVVHQQVDGGPGANYL